MIIIYDQSDKKRASKPNTNNLTDAPLSMDIISKATLIIELDEETYTCHKNRYTGETGPGPIDEFPATLRDLAVNELKMRDGIWDGEQEDIDDEF